MDAFTNPLGFMPNNTGTPLYTPPKPSVVSEAEEAMKLFNWFKTSGLSYDELDALHKLKMKGEDVNKLLGIVKPKTETELLNEKMTQMEAALNSLTEVITKMKETKNV